MTRFRASVWFAAARFALLMGVVLPAAACFDSQHEIFGPKDGVAVPGLEGTYDRTEKPLTIWTNIKAFTVSRASQGAEYLVFAHLDGEAEDKQREFGTLRAIPLGDDAYIAQVHGAGSVAYALLLLRVTRSNGLVTRVDEFVPDPKATAAIGRRYGVDLWHLTDKATIGISGSRAAVARFLRNCATAPSQTGQSYARVSEKQ